MALDRRENSDLVTDLVEGWAEANWDPDLTLGEWWSRLADAGLSAAHWPSEWFGRGWSRGQALTVQRVLRRTGVPGPPAGLGVMLAGPTILAHGTNEQKARFLPGIVRGTENWCQLFSEPGAGSDLAGLACRARRRDGRWEVTGQKVWTSNAQWADRAMLLARTDPDAPRHANLTWFALDMDQPGIEIRPLREMTGRSLFNEVFIDGATVDDVDIVGELNAGWSVARTTLLNERIDLGGGGSAVGAIPGVKAGMLSLRAGDALARPGSARRSSGTALALRGRSSAFLVELAKARGRSGDPLVRDRLAYLYITERLAELGLTRAQQQRPGPAADRWRSAAGSAAKLLGSRATRAARDLGARILGAEGTLWVGDRSPAGIVHELCLFSPAVSIYGGTDEVQRNILAERVLGLPRT